MVVLAGESRAENRHDVAFGPAMKHDMLAPGYALLRSILKSRSEAPDSCPTAGARPVPRLLGLVSIDLAPSRRKARRASASPARVHNNNLQRRALSLNVSRATASDRRQLPTIGISPSTPHCLEKDVV